MYYSLERPSVCVCQRRQLAQQSRWTCSHPRLFEAKIHALANRVLKLQLTLAIYSGSLNSNLELLLSSRLLTFCALHSTVKESIFSDIIGGTDCIFGKLVFHIQNLYQNR